MFKNKNNKIHDSDADGLSDQEEINVYGTDPLDPDTDKDGVSDGDEVKMGRNPKGPGMLKDLFIPNECNDYIPKALHPKRLAFHAVGAIVIHSRPLLFLQAVGAIVMHNRLLFIYHFNIYDFEYKL